MKTIHFVVDKKLLEATGRTARQTNKLDPLWFVTLCARIYGG